MKVSVKLQDQTDNHQKSHHSPPLLLRAKVPIAILNLPFLSHFSTTTSHPSDLSLALSTNFTSGPSLKLSYATASSVATAASTPPLTLSLKSGTGVFGSPKNSPLVISANFSFNPSNPANPNPTFSLLFKPQLGSFLLRKSTSSHPKLKPEVGSESNSINGDGGLDSGSYAFVPLDKPVVDVTELSLERKENDPIFKGIQLAANTHFPVANRASLNLRWWMDFPVDKMPVLRINKFSIERVEKTMKDVEERKRKNEGGPGEMEVLKGMCVWMQRELDGLSRANREMKYELGELRVGRAVRNGGDVGANVRKKVMPSGGGPSTAGFDEWKKKKNGGGYDNGNVKRNEEDNNKNGSNLAMDVESELQRAIKAASGSS